MFRTFGYLASFFVGNSKTWYINVKPGDAKQTWIVFKTKKDKKCTQFICSSGRFGAIVNGSESFFTGCRSGLSVSKIQESKKTLPWDNSGE